jgi:uncharacterized protein YbaR (Trm112 family)
MRLVICPICKQEVQVKSKFAYMTLYNHSRVCRGLS